MTLLTHFNGTISLQLVLTTHQDEFLPFRVGTLLTPFFLMRTLFSSFFCYENFV